MGGFFSRVRRCAAHFFLYRCTEGGAGFAASIDTHCVTVRILRFSKKKKHWRTSMCGRRDLGGPGPECANARRSSIYMDAKSMVWALQQVLPRTELQSAWPFFCTKKNHWRIFGILAHSRGQVSRIRSLLTRMWA